MSGSHVTGAQALIAACEKEGVTHIFGYPGGANIPIFDALHDSTIKLILSRHEQGATHMADGYARASNRTGVALVTSGPGATNAITGLLTAHMDSVPMVVICGQVASAHLGLEAFQEADVSGISFPVVKHSYLVKDVNDIPRVIKEAFHIAHTGRPGPVLIDMPKDVSATRFVPDFDISLDLPGYKIPESFDHKELARAAEAINRSRCPILLVGHGALLSDAHEAVIKLAEKARIPVTTTLLGKGAFPETHPLCVGMLGMHGTAYANKAILESDCIVSIGSRWDDRIIGDPKLFCPTAKKIHIDIDPSEKDKMLTVDYFILGDAKPVVEELIAQVHKLDTAAWLKKIDDWKKKYPLKYEAKGGLKAQEVCQKIDEMTQSKAVIVTDVGQHQMWAAQFCKTVQPDHWLSSGGAGTMGFGLPAAIGAQMARPGELVISISGDGGFQMTQAELATAAINKLPIKIIILDNKYLGMVRQWQHLFFDNRTIGVDLVGNPDFVTLAKAYGIKAMGITKREEMEKVLSEALAYNDGPCLIHAHVEKQENVFPMIPAGKGYESMLLEPPTSK
ncbi:MAG: biosynthetic-type acetolactate synthase large subunit [Chitinispirillaceae bacterium]